MPDFTAPSPVDSTPAPTSTATVAPPGDNVTGVYPKLKLTGDQAKMAGLGECMPGDEYEMTVRLKMTGGDDKSKEFDIVNTQPPTESEPAEDDDSGEEADEADSEDAAPPMPKAGNKIMSPSDAFGGMS